MATIKKTIRNNINDLYYLKGSGFTEADPTKATAFPCYDDAEAFVEVSKDFGVDDVVIEDAPGEAQVDEEVKVAPRAPAPAPRPVFAEPVAAPRAAVAQAAVAIADPDEGAVVQNDDGHSWGVAFIRKDGDIGKSARTFKTRWEARIHANRAIAKYGHQGARYTINKRVAVNSWVNPKTKRTNPLIGKGREGILG